MKLKIAIIDANYTEDGHQGMGASWLRWEAERRDNVDIVDANSADFILMTVSSQQGVSRVRAEIRKIKNKSAKIILGGGACYAPAIFDDYIHAACVGEGKNFVESLFSLGYDAACELPETWIPGESRPVIPARDFPWELPPLRNPDNTIRVFGSRGCRFKCLFCQTGWENDFRPNPNPEIMKAQIKELSRRGERIAIVTNDGADDSVSITGKQEFLSATVKNLKKIMPITRNTAKGVRLGVEGVSERLRVAVGKKVDNDDLISVSADCLKNGVGVRWFFIPGLPGETDADWDEMRYLVNGIKKYISKGVVMMNFHSFIPMPATPLCVFPVIDEYWERYDDFRNWFFHGMGFSRRVQLVNPSQYAGRMVRSMESMAADEREIRRGWWQENNKNWRIKYLNTPEQMRLRAARYAQRLGMEDNQQSSIERID